jgi:hypothetical protein
MDDRPAQRRPARVAPARASMATLAVAGAFLRVREPLRRSGVNTHQLDGTPIPSSPAHPAAWTSAPTQRTLSGLFSVRVWRHLYIQGRNPQKAAAQAAVSSYNARPAADRLRGVR